MSKRITLIIVLLCLFSACSSPKGTTIQATKAPESSVSPIPLPTPTPTVTVTPTLDAPTLLVAISISPTQIGISWKDNSTQELGFFIERSLDGVLFDVIAAVG